MLSYRGKAVKNKIYFFIIFMRSYFLQPIIYIKYNIVNYFLV